MNKEEIREIFNIDPDLPEVTDIIKHSRVVNYKKGEIIVRSAEDSQYLYRVRKGLVKIYSINHRDEESILLFYGPGDIFPLAWMAGRKSQDFYVQALVDCELVICQQDIMLEHLKNDVSVSYAMLSKVIDLFLLYTSRVNNLSLKYGRDRLAFRLLTLGSRFGEKQDGGLVLPYISQNDLAAALSMGRESVSREMTRFERLGLIKFTRKNIIILDPEKLRKEIGENVEISD